MLNRQPSELNTFRTCLHRAILTCVYLIAGSSSGSTAAEATAEQLEFFESKIRPLFAENCYKCHSQKADKLKGNGAPLWYLEAKDEGHGFSKKKNQDFQFYSTIMFVKTYLLKQPVETAAAQ